MRRKEMFDYLDMLCEVQPPDVNGVRPAREPSNSQKLSYFLKMLGSSLLSRVNGFFFFVRGQCDSGKSTLFGLIKKMMGKYASGLHRNVFAREGCAEATREKLLHVRVAIADDALGEADRLRPLLVKSFLCSGQDVVAKNGKKVSVTATFRGTPFLLTNHPPKFNDDPSGAIAKRVVVFPMESKIIGGYTSFQPMMEQPEFQNALFTLLCIGAQQVLAQPNYVKQNHPSYPGEASADVNDLGATTVGNKCPVYLATKGAIAGANPLRMYFKEWYETCCEKQLYGADLQKTNNVWKSFKRFLEIKGVNPKKNAAKEFMTDALKENGHSINEHNDKRWFTCLKLN